MVIYEYDFVKKVVFRLNKCIGVIGGMGPLATCDFMKKLLLRMDAKSDQEFIRISVDCNTNIPDRTAAILGKGENPLPEMIKSAIRLQCSGADVLTISCNTAHYFVDELSKCVDIPIMHMPLAVAEELKTILLTPYFIIFSHKTNVPVRLL